MGINIYKKKKTNNRELKVHTQSEAQQNIYRDRITHNFNAITT